MWTFFVILTCVYSRVYADGGVNKTIDMEVTNNNGILKCNVNKIPKVYKNSIIKVNLHSPAETEFKLLRCGEAQYDKNTRKITFSRFLISKFKKRSDYSRFYDGNLNVSLLQFTKDIYCLFTINDKCTEYIREEKKYDWEPLDSIINNCGIMCQFYISYTNTDLSYIQVNGQKVDTSIVENASYDAIGFYKYHENEQVHILCSKNPVSNSIVDLKFKSHSGFVYDGKKIKEHNYTTNRLDLNVTLTKHHDGFFIDCRCLENGRDISTFNIRLLLKLENNKALEGEKSATVAKDLVPISKDFILIILSCSVSIFIIASFIICLYWKRQKSRSTNANTTQMSYDALSEDMMASRNTVVDNEYRTPTDYTENAYSLPYSPRTVQEMYSTPLPKHQRSKDYLTMGTEPKPQNLKTNMTVSETPYEDVPNSESPYVELSNTTDSPYSEVSSKSDSPYAEVSSKSDSPYIEISNTAFAKMQPISVQVLPTKLNPLDKAKKTVMNVADRYCNVFNEQKYVNANMSKEDYAEPAYYDLGKPKRQ